MNNLSNIQIYLRNVLNRDQVMVDADITVQLQELKAEAVMQGDQAKAKLTWCYETILKIQSKYLLVFQMLKAEEYYSAWCDLENIEIALHFLQPHTQFLEEDYQLEFIAKHVPKYQSIFPYKMFMSTEFLELEKECSICKQPVSIRDGCGHRPGEIYNGELCSRKITKLEVLGTSLVEKPAHKYTVLFTVDPETGKSRDHYDYSLVRYLMKRLNNPFDGWDVEWTKIRHPHSFFKDVGRNDLCPCESGKKYKACCLKETGVLRPHCQFIFSVMSTEDLEKIEYHY